MSDLQEKILALAEKVKNPPSWWWKVLGGLIFLVMVIWIRYLLSKRTELLAAQNTEVTIRRLDADQAALAARVQEDVQKRILAESIALEAVREAQRRAEELFRLEAEHKKQVGLLRAVADKDWDALNELAGIKTP